MIFYMEITCEVEGCTRPVHVKKRGLCSGHYGQWYRGASFTRLPPVDYTPCAVEGCDKQVASRRLCGPHASISSRYKIPTDDFVRLLSERYCYGCNNQIPEGVRVSFDHDHGCCPTNNTCGRCVRGTLCYSCNTTLGKYRDRPMNRPDLLEYVASAPHISFAPWEPIYKVR